jgi:hypothetical protein
MHHSINFTHNSEEYVTHNVGRLLVGKWYPMGNLGPGHDAGVLSPEDRFPVANLTAYRGNLGRRCSCCLGMQLNNL